MAEPTKKKGGKRPGAGRPVGTLASATLQTQKQRELLVKLLAPRVEKIFEALALKAEQGDVAAAKELFDRAWGKATQSVDLSNKDGTLKTIIIQKASDHRNGKSAS